jgi:hypothetical protein
MVALEPGEPLLLYIGATVEVVSMVLVAERPEPQQPQEPKGAPADGSCSQDLDNEGGPHHKEPSGSQLLKSTLSPEPKIGSQLSEASLGPEDQKASRSQIPEPTSGPDNQHTSGS